MDAKEHAGGEAGPIRGLDSFNGKAMPDEAGHLIQSIQEDAAGRPTHSE